VTFAIAAPHVGLTLDTVYATKDGIDFKQLPALPWPVKDHCLAIIDEDREEERDISHEDMNCSFIHCLQNTGTQTIFRQFSNVEFEKRRPRPLP
jgi:hypothetical protein